MFGVIIVVEYLPYIWNTETTDLDGNYIRKEDSIVATSNSKFNLPLAFKNKVQL